MRSKGGKQVFDRLMIKVPLVGWVIVQGAVVRPCRFTSTLLQGNGLADALAIISVTPMVFVVALYTSGTGALLVRQRVSAREGVVSVATGTFLSDCGAT